MLKSMLLASVRPFYEAEKEQGAEKTQAEKNADERAKIASTTPEEKEEDDEKDNDEAGDGDSSGDDTKGEDDDKKDDNPDGTDDDKEEAKELTTEQKEIEKLKKTIERLQRRIGKTTGEKAQIAKDLLTAQAALEAKAADGSGLTEEEVERRAEIKANEKTTQADFARAQKKLIAEAKKSDKDFLVKVNEMAADVAPIPAHMIGILDDMDNGGAVLSYLANNVDEYEDIFNQPLPKMTRMLDKIGQKIEAEKKPKPKEISKVPAPNEPIKGNERSPNVLSDKQSMDDWVRTRNAQVKERREQRNR